MPNPLKVEEFGFILPMPDSAHFAVEWTRLKEDAWAAEDEVQQKAMQQSNVPVDSHFVWLTEVWSQDGSEKIFYTEPMTDAEYAKYLSV